jgi:hypothetical protein
MALSPDRRFLYGARAVSRRVAAGFAIDPVDRQAPARRQRLARR